MCSAVVAHRTISQVRPAQHTVRVLEAAAPGGKTLQCRPRRGRARADTAHTPMHATRDRPIWARACRRPSGGVRPPGTAQPRAQLSMAHRRIPEYARRRPPAPARSEAEPRTRTAARQPTSAVMHIPSSRPPPPPWRRSPAFPCIHDLKSKQVCA